ncbi:MAG TPA: hypothetical protein VN924_03185 [Bryobacteraceae bacterium]|nr:hypothetical protein [Bryobacteraceae bacterium]
MKLNPTPGRMTRRQLAAAILAGTATAAAAQAPQPTAATATAPSTPAGELQAAREQNQRTAETLAQTQVPIDAEPAFHFTA